MNDQTPSTLQTIPKFDLFGIIVGLVLLGVLLLQLGSAVQRLDERVSKLETAVFTKGGTQ